MMGLSGATTRSDSPPFTPTQWQELEHQALIYKYMVSGLPVPPELIFSIRGSMDSALASRLLPHHQPSYGWGYFQMSYGRKPDPEPGRCRRTDGKKWRCSREAYADSKYCEKHMHRGRNRSRKPMDQNQTQTPTSITSSLSSSNNTTNLNCSLSSSASSSTLDHNYRNSSNMVTTLHHHQKQTSPRFSNSAYFGHYLYPYSASSANKPIDSGLSLQNSSSSQLNILGSDTCPLTDKDFRYLHGVGEGVGERTFFQEPSRSFQESPYHHHRHQHRQQHCFVLGSDMFKPTSTSRQDQDLEQEQEQEDCEPKKPLLHFFGDDWPSTKNGASDSWLDLASNSSRLRADG